jgi:hypothetical protein
MLRNSGMPEFRSPSMSHDRRQALMPANGTCTRVLLDARARHEDGVIQSERNMG